MVDVTLADGSKLTATDHHPFWDVTTATFTYADALHTGDQLREANGGLITITNVVVFDENVTAYNLTVDGIHTYYAGTTPVLVHNSCGLESLGEGPEADAVNEPSWQRQGFGDQLHHVFPQEFDSQFAARGIDIDDYTVPLDSAEHGVIHSLGYNEAMWGAIENKEQFLGRMLNPDEVMATGHAVME